MSETKSAAQQRPGPKPRQHRACPSATTRASALNKGRDRSPGNTTIPRSRSTTSRAAQQRPGPKPRQHVELDDHGAAHLHRSTKAGTEAPATRRDCVHASVRIGERSTKAGTEAPATRMLTPSTWLAKACAQQRPGPKPRQHPDVRFIDGASNRAAQQRPGPKPRQHSASMVGPPFDAPRSTKAGTEAPATQHQPAPGSRDGGRSTKAGTEAPATPTTAGNCKAAQGCAQQRPGPKPRQHSASMVGPPFDAPRSTKAGTEAPATRVQGEGLRDRRGHRSTKAGTEAPATPQKRGSSITKSRHAQQRPGPKPRQHRDVGGVVAPVAGRSTKAGTEAPATQVPRPCHGGQDRALNKGRDRSPGNTASKPWCAATPVSTLNKGRDRSPGNTQAPSSHRTCC